MRELCFVDTNVLVYAADARDPRKQKIAQALMLRLNEAKIGVISTQVLTEYFNTLTGKLKLPAEDALNVLDAMRHWRTMTPTANSVFSAAQRCTTHSISIWDSLIVQAALDAKVSVLYSEDMQHGRRFDTLEVINPFLPATSELAP
jgi:predicted nucleic acid-binding protein